MSTESNTILVVDDEPGMADLFTAWLADAFEVRTAYGGTTALQQVDSEVDVVLLDRRMPDRSGDEVLEEIRERGVDCCVAMVTAVQPDFDIVEMGFDGYVVKPVDRDELLATVERMLAFETLGPGARAYYSRVSKKEALEAQKGPGDLDESPRFESLEHGVQVFGGKVVSLAERAIEEVQGALLSGDRPDVRIELRKWQDRLDELNESDSLYAVAKEHVDELESNVRRGDDTAINQFLEAVADGFIAEDVWLDETVQRALNLIFYEKNSDTFVIKRRPIADFVDEDASATFEVSQEVRTRASSELESRSRLAR